MKKILLSVVCLLAVASVANAQLFANRPSSCHGSTACTGAVQTAQVVVVASCFGKTAACTGSRTTACHGSVKVVAVQVVSPAKVPAPPAPPAPSVPPPAKITADQPTVFLLVNDPARRGFLGRAADRHMQRTDDRHQRSLDRQVARSGC